MDSSARIRYACPSEAPSFYGAHRGQDETCGGSATIGVYGFDISSFLETLREAEVGLVLDVRQRRGVRGREYAWANSLRLQASRRGRDRLRAPHRAGAHDELRELQYREDAGWRWASGSRAQLADEYRERYNSEILDQWISPITGSPPDREGKRPAVRRCATARPATGPLIAHGWPRTTACQ